MIGLRRALLVFAGAGLPAGIALALILAASDHTPLPGLEAALALVIGWGFIGADDALGSGLRGLADRVEALDGRLRVVSPPGAGTVVRAELPCEP